MASFCRNCGSPIVGGSRFCANCGAATDVPPASSVASPPPVIGPVSVAAQPVKPGLGTGAKLLLAGVVVLLVGGLAVAAGLYYVVSRVSQKVHSLSRSITDGNRTESRSEGGIAVSDPCRYLSSKDVSLAAKVEIVGTQAEGAACSYLAKGDEADMASRHATAMMGAKGADLNTQKTIQQFSGGLFKALQDGRPEQSSGPGGTVPVLSISVDRGEHAEAEMRMNSKVLGGLGPGSERLTGIGDEAFVAGDSMIMVRKGEHLIRIMYMTCPCGTDAIKPLARKIADAL